VSNGANFGRLLEEVLSEGLKSLGPSGVTGKSDWRWKRWRSGCARIRAAGKDNLLLQFDWNKHYDAFRRCSHRTDNILNLDAVNQNG
jgi:hypothetical protein